MMKEINWKWIDIKKIKVDGRNPNVLSKERMEALKKNITEFGWHMPIIVNQAYLIADGEQKLMAARALGLKKVPVLRKKLSEAQRRTIRLSMNKIRGIHDVLMDADEYKFLLKEGGMEELTGLIGVSEQEILNSLDKAEKDKEGEGSEGVDRLGKLLITCPGCGHKFEKKDQK